MQYTDNYSLRKPQNAETAKVSDLNYNADKIDGIMADDRQISLAMYVSGNTYNTGDIVGYENPSTHRIRAYRCLVDNVTGVWDSTKWTLTNLAAEIIDAKQSGGTEVIANPTGTAAGTLNTVKIDDVIYEVGGDSANQNIADAFSELQTYAVGDYCIYESILYKCTTAVTTAGAWDSTKWQSCVVTDEMGSGGGGGSSTFAGLTDVNFTNLSDDDFAQYDATSQKWKNVAISGISVQPVIYSDEEREVGVWVDGRPLYECTFNIGTLANDSNEHTYPHGLSNVYEVPYIQAITKSSGGVFYSLSTNCPGQSGMGVCIGCDATNIYYRNQWLASPNPTYVTIRYTKSTDAAGSGTWTPQGVPAVHYSTDEQVVGTWIDGSTVYERVFTGLSTPTNGTSWAHISSIDTTDWGELIDCKIYRTLSGYNKYAALPIAEYSASAGGIKDLAVTVVNAIFNATVTMAIVRYTKSST